MLVVVVVVVHLLFLDWTDLVSAAPGRSFFSLFYIVMQQQRRLSERFTVDFVYRL